MTDEQADALVAEISEVIGDKKTIEPYDMRFTGNPLDCWAVWTSAGSSFEFEIAESTKPAVAKAYLDHLIQVYDYMSVPRLPQRKLLREMAEAVPVETREQRAAVCGLVLASLYALREKYFDT